MADPIIVPADPARAQMAAGVRQVLLGAGAVAAALGANHVAGELSDAATYAGAIVAVAAFVWGNLATRRAAVKSAAMANALPDSVAQTR